MPNFVEISGHFAYGLMFFSFLVRSMARLRILSICASIAGIYYSATATGNVLWAPIIWNIVFVGVNFWQLWLIYLESRVHELSEEEKFLHKGALRNFSTFEVKNLVRLASRRKLQQGEKLITLGEKLSHLYLIAEGNVRIELDRLEIARLGAGNFVGEMSFLTGDPTRADVFGQGEGTLLCWERIKLDAWAEGDPTRTGRLQSALGAQVVGLLMERSTPGKS